MHLGIQNEQRGDLCMFHLHFPTRIKAISADVLLCMTTKCSAFTLTFTPPTGSHLPETCPRGVTIGQPCTADAFSLFVRYSIGEEEGLTTTPYKAGVVKIKNSTGR